MKLSLYYQDTCPFCRQVLPTLENINLPVALKNIDYELEFKHELALYGGKKQVPCLKIEVPGEQPVWVYESNDIIKLLKRLDKYEAVREAGAAV